LSLCLCAEDQVKIGGFVEVKLTGVVAKHREFEMPDDHVCDEDYEGVDDCSMANLLERCTASAKSAIFLWTGYIAPRELKSARRIGGNTPPKGKRRRSCS
jgi:hypothetical protein